MNGAIINICMNIYKNCERKEEEKKNLSLDERDLLIKLSIFTDSVRRVNVLSGQ
jgi:hypothetical protein